MRDGQGGNVNFELSSIVESNLIQCPLLQIQTYNTQTQKLRLINKTCFPVSYPDSFYKDVVKSKNENLNKFAYHNGFVVGAICARVEPLPKTEGTGSDDQENSKSSRIYIMTLGVFAAYRNRGIGVKLVQSILDHYNGSIDPSKDDSVEMKNVKEIVLHVQISNLDAIKFYIEKFGFVQGEKVENYYKRIDPPHCYVLRKTLA